MADINDRLRCAAKAGFEFEIKALLREPGCDALSRGEHGTTALMWAASHGHEACVRLLLPTSDALSKNKNGWTALMCAASPGHESCVRLLLPASDALSKDENGLTASDWTRDHGYESLAQFIDAYAFAKNEHVSLEVAATTEAPHGRAAPRM